MIPDVVIQCALISVMAAAVVAVVFVIVLAVIATVIITLGTFAAKWKGKPQTGRRRYWQTAEREI